MASYLSPGYLSPGRFYGAPLNGEPAVTEDGAIPPDLTFFDSTIRKILMTPGIRLAVPDFVEIAHLGNLAGLRQCFLNVYWWGNLDDPEPHALRVAEAVMADSDYEVTLFSDVFAQPNWQDGLERLVSLAPAAMQVCLPLPDMAGRRAPVDMTEQIARLVDVCAALRDAGVEPTVGALDCGRTQEQALVDFVAAAVEAGVTRIDLSDSSSSLSPEAMKRMIGRFRHLGLPITMHVHNDVGLANAACLAAVVAGGHPDVSACGISYRAGFAALEAVAAALEAMYGVTTGLDWDAVQRLCRRVGNLIPPDALRAVSGSHAFVKEFPGEVSRYLLPGGPPDVASDHLLVAEGFGARTELVWGRQTVASRNAVRVKLEAMGRPADDADVTAAQAGLADALAGKGQYPVWLTDDEATMVLASLGNGE